MKKKQRLRVRSEYWNIMACAISWKMEQTAGIMWSPEMSEAL